MNGMRLDGSRLPALLAVQALGLLAGPGAMAWPALSEPVLVELQLPSDEVTILVWDRLKSERTCLPAPFALPGGEEVVLDRLDFPEQPAVVNEADFVGISMPVEVFLKPAACLAEPACDQHDYHPAAGPLALELRYTLELEVDQDSDPSGPKGQLCLDPSVAGSGNLPAALLAAFSIGDCPELPLDALGRLLPDGARITRTGVGATTDGERLALRMEIDGPSAGSESSWQSFRAGALAPSAPAMSWSLFADGRLLQERVRRALDEELSAGSEPFQLTGGPTVTWSGGGMFGGGHIDAAVTGVIPGGFEELCPNPITIDPVDIDLDFRIDANDPGWLKRRVFIDPDPDDDDVSTCAFLFGTPTLEFAALVTTLVVGAIAADLYDAEQGQLGLPGDCADRTSSNCQEYCTALADDEYVCAERFELDEPLDLGGPTIGVFEVTHMTGLAAGAVIGGDFVRVVRPNPWMSLELPNPFIPIQPLRVDNGAISFGVQGGCSSLKLGYSGSFRIRGSGFLCEAITVLDDPPAEHASSTSIYELLGPGIAAGDALGDRYVGVRFPATYDQAVIDRFFADPYPLKVLVRSTVGLRCFEIPAPEPADVAAGLEMLTDAIVQCAGRRYALQMPQAVLDRLWLVDPPPFEVQLEAAYTKQPPAGEVHSAMLRDLNVISLGSSVVARSASGADVDGSISFPESSLLLSGNVELDLGSFGRRELPFVELRRQRLSVMGLDADLRAELQPAGGMGLHLKLREHDLPAGVRRAAVRFELPPCSLRLRADLVSPAGPADLDADGHVDLEDWQRMGEALDAACSGRRTEEADLDGDGDTDSNDAWLFARAYVELTSDGCTDVEEEPKSSPRPVAGALARTRR